MTKRIASTLALWTVVIATLALGGIDGGVVLLTLIAGLTQMEVYRLLRGAGYPPKAFSGILFGVLTVLGSYYAVAPDASITTSNPWVAFSLVGILAIALMHTPMEKILPAITSTVLGYVLAPFALSFFLAIVIALRSGAPEAEPLYCVVWVIAVAKFSDVGGLLVGSRFGRTALAPKLSPRKTVEGAIGGLFFSIATGQALFHLWPTAFPEVFCWITALTGSVILSLVAIPSDLVGSVLKRNAAVKDSGFHVPGIGGLLDLVDSLLLTAPAAYFLLILIL